MCRYKKRLHKSKISMLQCGFWHEIAWSLMIKYWAILKFFWGVKVKPYNAIVIFWYFLIDPRNFESLFTNSLVTRPFSIRNSVLEAYFSPFASWKNRLKYDLTFSLERISEIHSKSVQSVQFGWFIYFGSIWFHS